MTDEVTAPTGLDLLAKLAGLETQIAELHAAHVGLKADLSTVRASVQLVMGDLGALASRVNAIEATHSVKHELRAMSRSGPHRVWGAQA